MGAHSNMVERNPHAYMGRHRARSWAPSIHDHVFEPVSGILGDHPLIGAASAACNAVIGSIDTHGSHVVLRCLWPRSEHALT